MDNINLKYIFILFSATNKQSTQKKLANTRKKPTNTTLHSSIMDSPRGITAHRARVARRRDLSSTKGKSRETRNVECNLQPWITSSHSNKSKLGRGSRRNSLTSAVAEPVLLDDGGPHFYTSNGTGRVLKKNTLPEYQLSRREQAWQDEENAKIWKFEWEEGSYDRVYTEPVPVAPTTTHTPEEWDASYRKMVEQKHQDELAKVQGELVCQKRLYDDMARHARDGVLALDQAEERVECAWENRDYWRRQYEEEKVHRAADVDRNYRQLNRIIQLEEEHKELLQRMENRDSVHLAALRRVTQLEEENRQLLQKMEMIHNLAKD